MNPTNTRITRFFRNKLSVAIFGLLTASTASADDLLEIFNLAVNNDPQIRQARATYNASHTTLSQGRSFLLPTIDLTASTSRDTSGTADPDPSGRSPLHSFGRGFNTKGYNLNLRQALVNFQAWYTYKSAEFQDQAAETRLVQAEQQLIMKVATAYFNVLRSQENLATFRAEQDAANQVLEQTQQRFDVGLIPITDVYDSQASADLAAVNTLVEENNLNQSLEALEAITGQPHNDVAELREEFPITPIDPVDMNDWVNLAQEGNLDIRLAELDLAAKEEDARAARSALYPTVQITAGYGWNESANIFSFAPGAATERSSISLDLTVPIFSGGLNSARKLQAYYTRDASEEALMLSRRTNTQSTRNAYRSVETDVRSVAAQQQFIVSAQSALDATQVGVEVGTRNVVELVLSQRALFQAQRAYDNARFDYVMDTLTLKQAAGVLTPEDVMELNEWLAE
ncbi:MAG: TolC family outer membrane protein [Pseudomonadota bacterium]